MLTKVRIVFSYGSLSFRNTAIPLQDVKLASNGKSKKCLNRSDIIKHIVLELFSYTIIKISNSVYVLSNLAMCD